MTPEIRMDTDHQSGLNQIKITDCSYLIHICYLNVAYSGMVEEGKGRNGGGAHSASDMWEWRSRSL